MKKLNEEKDRDNNYMANCFLTCLHCIPENKIIN